MLTRAFNAVGLMVQIVEWKALLLASSAKRSAKQSAIAMLSVYVAAIVGLAGMATLIGAGYVALETIVGVAAALAAVGVFLLMVASIILIIAHARSKSGDQTMTDHEMQKKIERGKQELRSMLGMTDNDADSSAKRSGTRIPASPQPDSDDGFDAPKVLMAAGFAALSVLGPGRLLKTVRIVSAVASVTALANHAIQEHRDQHDPQRSV